MPSDPDGRSPRRGRGSRRAPRPDRETPSGSDGRPSSEQRPSRSRRAGRRRAAGSSTTPKGAAANPTATGAGAAKTRGAHARSPRSGPPRSRSAASGSGSPNSGALALAKRHPGKIVVALASALALILTGFGWHSVDILRSNLTTAGGLELGGGKDGAIDILMVGIDSRTDAMGNPLSQDELDMLRAGEADATNTDTIMLIRIPNDGSSATAVSIPRDSYVQVPGVGKSKINAAYGETKEIEREKLIEQGADPHKVETESTQAGRHALLDSVTQLTGITVDHYAEVGLLGFVLLTDAVGGVPVCLNEPVDEPMSGAHFTAGEQTLKGADALSFVRQRHGLQRGDLDRIVRQQAYLASLAHEVLSAKLLASPSKVNELSAAVERSIVVDAGWDAIGFARQLQNLSGGDITFRTIPVADPAGTSPDGESIVQVDPDQVHSFFDSLLGRAPEGESDAGGDEPDAENDDGHPLDVTPSQTNVNILNSTSTSGLASQVSTSLSSVGYGEGRIANYTGAPVSTSEVQVAPGAHDQGLAVARALGGLDVTTDSSIAPGQVSVVLAEDYAGPGSAQWTGPVVSGTDGSSSESGSSTTSGSGAGSGTADAGSTNSDAAAGPGAGAGGTDITGPAVDAGGDGPRCVN